MNEGRRVVVEVEAEAEGQRLDLYLASRPEVGLSRSRLHKLIRQGAVQVAGQTVKPSRPVRAGEAVVLELPKLEPPSVEPEPIELDILYEDEHFLVVNKPASMVVHPAAGVRSGTVVNALLHHCAGRLSGIGGVERPGIVHRLDKETSGLLIAAKTDPAHRSLAAQFASRRVAKHYQALVHGLVRSEEGVIEGSIGRDPKHRKRMALVDGGRPAVSEYRVLERFEAHSLLVVSLRTGRTHQIRVHLASVGHPVLGDRLYGGRRRWVTEGRSLVGRQALHAWRLSFDHPISGQRLWFEAPLPEDFRRALELLRRRLEAGNR
jgi:23S rRNA pseudouridine1911/1915/1917 synthase